MKVSPWWAGRSPVLGPSVPVRRYVSEFPRCRPGGGPGRPREGRWGAGRGLAVVRRGQRVCSSRALLIPMSAGKYLRAQPLGPERW